MAISFVAGSSAIDTATSVTCDKPTGTIENDVMVALFCNGQDDGTTPSSTGWTNIDFQEESIGSDSMASIFYKVAGGSEPASYTFDYPSSTSNVTSCIIGTFRGVDTSNVLDVTYASGSHYYRGGNDDTPAPPAITTVTDGAFVVNGSFHKDNTTTDHTPSSGYSEVAEVLDAFRYTFMQYKEVATAGVETPGDITFVGAPTSVDPSVFTIALRPAAGGGGGGGIVPIIHLRRLLGMS